MTESISILGAEINRVQIRYDRPMDEAVGLRERKKARTRRAISEAAISLFLERGYDDVSVVEVAAAAEVSKRTLFAYFPTKDDLVLHRFADHEDESARVVRGRAPGEAPLAALHRQRLEALQQNDPITGLCDIPEIMAFYRLVATTPALAAARTEYARRGEEALAAALLDAAPGAGPLAARLAAGQIVSVLQTLAVANQLRLTQGATAEEALTQAVADLDLAFAMLDGGLAAFR
jgi:AcrR family transcriptional regulator